MFNQNMIFHAQSLNVASKRGVEKELGKKKKEGEKNFFEGINFLHALLSYYCTTATATPPPPTLRRAARHRTAVEVVFERLKLFCFRFPIVSSSFFYCAENQRNRTGKLELQKQQAAAPSATHAAAASRGTSSSSRLRTRLTAIHYNANAQTELNFADRSTRSNTSIILKKASAPLPSTAG